MTVPPQKTYRSELDGLRAIAVLAVLGYHAGYNDFAGGFMGVDVFFVLSGYLITAQIRDRQEREDFTLLAFWLRRLRRLLPALLPVLALSVFSALIFKGEGAFAAFAAHFLSAGFFVSNYLFLSEADYFARASDTNLLLHTWSLSLEMQFYIVTPILLMLMARFSAWWVSIALGLLAAASLALSEVLIRSGHPEWAFFGLLPRYWEFAAGGLVALLPQTLGRVPWLGAGLRLLGLGLIFTAIFGAAPERFPGFGAGFAIAGTVLVLIAPMQPRDPFRWFLESRGMRWIGLRSYAIYLVHWPLFVTVTPTAMNRSEDILSVALLASLVLGHLIYRYVEMPVRSGSALQSAQGLMKGATICAVGVIAIWGMMISPVPRLLSDILPLSASRAALTELDAARDIYAGKMRFLADARVATDNVRVCSFDRIKSHDAMMDCLSDQTDEAVMLMGDSHGRDTLLALQEAFPEAEFVMLHASSCVPAQYPDCFSFLPEVIETLARSDRLDRVILSSRWGYGNHTFVASTLSQLAETDARVVVIGPGPTFYKHIEEHVLSATFQGEDLRQTGTLPLSTLAFNVAATNEDLRAMTEQAGARYVDRYEMFCSGEACSIVTLDGQYSFQDNEHLTPAGLRDYAKKLTENRLIREFLIN